MKVRRLFEDLRERSFAADLFVTLRIHLVDILTMSLVVDIE
jgi:hypothetical protein